MKVKQVILIVIAIILTVIATQNMQSVMFHILMWEVSLPLVVLICIGIAGGFLLNSFYHLIRNPRAKAEKKGKKKKGAQFPEEPQSMGNIGQGSKTAPQKKGIFQKISIFNRK
ncbi:MAG: LapA family protein [bacterium]|nr:LapA family protein [bacterium]